MDVRGKRFVVIGGAGLIGSHTVDALTREDVAEIRKGTFSKDETIVFVHTGGSVALFAYEALFSEKAAQVYWRHSMPRLQRRQPKFIPKGV